MPSWEIHLGIATDIIDKIKVEKNSFLIGNIVPDAERHVVKDFSVFVPYNVSHYAEKQVVGTGKELLPNVKKFLEHHDNHLKNSLLKGYYCHLLADYYWNKLTAVRYTVRDSKGNCVGIKMNNGDLLPGTVKERAQMKRQDFGIFKRYLVRKKEILLPECSAEVMKELELADEIPFLRSDIDKIIDYLKENRKEILSYSELDRYQLYTQEQIEKDYKNCVEYIVKFLR